MQLCVSPFPKTAQWKPQVVGRYFGRMYALYCIPHPNRIACEHAGSISDNFLGWWPNVFPVRLTWLSSCFQLIGGGSAVLSSMVFSILSELVPEEYR